MGTHVYLWWVHVDIWQNQCNIVKLKNKSKVKLKKKKTCHNVLKYVPKLVHFVLVCYALKLLLKVARLQESG